MANGNRSSRGGGRRAGGSRGGGSRGGSRGRGGNNALPMVIAIVAVVAVVGVFVAMSGGKKKKRDDYVSTELTSNSVVPKDDAASKPKKPERPPPPQISEEIIAKAKEIVAWMDGELAEANKHYEEAMAAKDGNDEELWQSKLHEARDHYLNIRERWNNEVVDEIQGELPTGSQWDAEEVANYYVGKEAGKITRAIERLAYVSKQLRR